MAHRQPLRCEAPSTPAPGASQLPRSSMNYVRPTLLALNTRVMPLARAYACTVRRYAHHEARLTRPPTPDLAA